LPIMIWLLARTFEKHQFDWEVIVVDDNSPDGTLEVAEQLQRLYGPHRIVRIPPSTNPLSSPFLIDPFPAIFYQIL